MDSAIGGNEFIHAHTAILEEFDPLRVGTEARPAGAAQSKDHRIAALLTIPFCLQIEPHAKAIEPSQPCAQERRCLHCLGEYPARGSDECLDAETMAPFDQRFGRESANSGFEGVARFPIMVEKSLQWFAMSEIEAAAPGHQKFARRRCHVIDHPHLGAAFRQHFGGHQAGRPGTDNFDMKTHGGR